MADEEQQGAGVGPEGEGPSEEELRAHPHLTRETEYLPIPFSADGTLDGARR